MDQRVFMSAYSKGLGWQVSLIVTWNISVCEWASHKESQPFFQWCNCSFNWGKKKKKKREREREKSVQIFPRSLPLGLFCTDHKILSLLLTKRFWVQDGLAPCSSVEARATTAKALCPGHPPCLLLVSLYVLRQSWYISLNRHGEPLYTGRPC